jgi:membrane associated rhomboid family serine protease
MPMNQGLWERILGEDRDTSTLEGGAGNDPGQERRAKPLIGWISCVVGVVLGVGMVFAALFGGGANITAGALGVGFAVLGYFLGARRLATATVFLCVAAILFGLAASQGLIPGIAPSDRVLPSISVSQPASGLYKAFACQPGLSCTQAD